jgi:hypothetical protein
LAHTPSEATIGGLRTRIRQTRGGHYGSLKPQRLASLAFRYGRDRLGRRRYRVLDEEALLATRKSDTAFVFGSGRSLLEIHDDEWGAISQFDTISLREFPRQHWIRADYHLTSEVDFLDEYAQRLRENPLYRDTVFIVQEGFLAERGNDLVGRGLLHRDARLFRFRRTNRGEYGPPSRTVRRLVHGYNSIFDATNFAFAMGYRRIVLAGADYYNKEYFWLDSGETRSYESPGIEATEQWPQAEAIVAMLGEWGRLLAKDGVELCVYNPRSLLARQLGVFTL